MLSVLLLAAAKPWTYWMALPLLAVNALLVLGVLTGYYRKVAVPRYQWSVYESDLRARQPAVLGRHVSPLRQTHDEDVREQARAA